MIRPASEADAAAIAKIYNQAIEDKVFATCDVVPVSVESRLEWLATHKDPHPAFVLDHESRGVIGWSALNKFSVRPAYTSIAEISVYVDHNYRNRVTGGRLFLHLIGVAKQLGYRSLVSLTLEKNAPSIRGLMAVGFRKAACLSEVAVLHGERVNVAWLQLDLSDESMEKLSAFARYYERLVEDSD